MQGLERAVHVEAVVVNLRVEVDTHRSSPLSVRWVGEGRVQRPGGCIRRERDVHHVGRSWRDSQVSVRKRHSFGIVLHLRTLYIFVAELTLFQNLKPLFIKIF